MTNDIESIEGEIDEKIEDNKPSSHGKAKQIINWIINALLIIWGIWWGLSGLFSLIAAFKADWIVMLVLTVVIAVGVWAFFLPVGVIMMVYGYINDTIENVNNRWEMIGKVILGLLVAVILPFLVMFIVQFIVYFIIGVFN